MQIEDEAARVAKKAKPLRCGWCANKVYRDGPSDLVEGQVVHFHPSCWDERLVRRLAQVRS